MKNIKSNSKMRENYTKFLDLNGKWGSAIITYNQLRKCFFNKWAGKLATICT